MMGESFLPTVRTKLRRGSLRSHYESKTLYGILDSGCICRIGYVIDGQPVVTPTAYGREGDAIFWQRLKIESDNDEKASMKCFFERRAGTAIALDRRNTVT